MTIKELSEQYGGPELIPSPELHKFLCLPETREALAKLVKPYRDLIQQADEEKDKEAKELMLRAAGEKLEEFKKHPFIASVRKRCKSDLVWLAVYFCWETNPFSNGQDISENRITEKSHAPILDFFVKKDDTKKLKDQDVHKIRLLLWPRNGNKSTIDVVDAVQWILNFPEVRILYFTGDDDLAVKFVRETKGHFVINKLTTTLMNLFFPEFCVDEAKLGNQFEFNCPVWADKALLRGEPTVQAASVNSGLGGRHYDVIKADDAVYDRNSETTDLCLKVAKKIGLTVRPGKMLMHKGYLDIVGTRYHEDDYYGALIQKNLIGEVKTTDGLTVDGRPWVLTENNQPRATAHLILIAKGIQIKPEVVQKLEKENRPVTYIEAGEDGCLLLLPEIMSYSHLMGEYADNEETFESQINQNPRAQGSITFDRPLMMRNTVHFEELPYSGPTSQTWDFAGPFNKQKSSDRDFCTASCAIWDNKGTCFINDLMRNRYKPADLAKAVVEFASKYHPFVIGIEDAGGAQFLYEEIKREARKTLNQQVIDVCHRIDWITPSNVKGAKQLRIANLHPWLVNGRIKFAHYLLNGQIGVLYDEFERCLHGKGHDDIPDVISYQLRYEPRASQIVTKEANNPLYGMPTSKNSPVPYSELPYVKQATFNLLYEPNTDQFGRVGYGPPPEPIIAPEPEPDLAGQPQYEGVPNFLGVL